jgi:hypothetical protein
VALLAAHGLLERPTRDLDFFGRPEQQAQVRQLAAGFERACRDHGLDVRTERDAEGFIRLTVEDGTESCEVDTRLGPAFDLRELGSNKVLAIFDRAAPRDFVDLAELTKHFALDELIELAAAKDPGLDLDVLDLAMGQIERIPRERLALDQRSHEELMSSVDAWRVSLRRLREREQGPSQRHGETLDDRDLGLDL